MIFRTTSCGHMSLKRGSFLIFLDWDVVVSSSTIITVVASVPDCNVVVDS